jgi:predicted dehydrogenase
MAATVPPTVRNRITRDARSRLITPMTPERMVQNLGFAIFGCGLIGNRRAATLPAGSLRYACDVDLAKAAALAGRYMDCRAADRPEQAWSDPGVRVAIVSAANLALAPLTFAAVRAGKHVLVEKPGAITSAELKRIAEAAAETNAKVRLGYNHRFHPAFLKLRELQAAEDTGEFMFLRARYGHGGRVGYDREWRADPKLSGGGELIDQGVHLIDLASLWLSDFDRVEGHAATYFWDMPVDDNAFVSLRDTKGRTAWLQVSCTEWKNLFSFELYFQRAKFHVEGLGGSYGLERLYHYRMLPEMGPPETVVDEFPRGDQSWNIELQEFLKDIEQDRPPSPGLADGIRTLKVVEEIYRLSGYSTQGK